MSGKTFGASVELLIHAGVEAWEAGDAWQCPDDVDTFLRDLAMSARDDMRSTLLEERARLFDLLGVQCLNGGSLADLLTKRLRRDREDIRAARLVAWVSVLVGLVAAVACAVVVGRA
ncbi:MAG: hypothetical protein KDE27_19390 [Planctomycetes bacterium]|nr:hypothetical protein [Planctomycetota bacterium]